MTTALARLVEALEPGATPVRLTRLKGGLGARMHRLRYEMPSGGRRNVVLRRYVPGWDRGRPEDARYEFAVLQLLARAGVPAPRPLLLDADGAYCGGPALLLSYVPGRSYLRDLQRGEGVSGLARALSLVHGVTPDGYDIGWLQDRSISLQRLERFRESCTSYGPLAVQALRTLVERMGSLTQTRRCLIHEDYHPGNTVWFRGRLTAIIDWSDAGLGDPRVDVAQCRADLVVSHGAAAAEAFLRCYEDAVGSPMPDMWFFDLRLGLLALLNYKKWLAGYHDGGLRHLNVDEVGARVEAFVRRALGEAARSVKVKPSPPATPPRA